MFCKMVFILFVGRGGGGGRAKNKKKKFSRKFEKKENTQYLQENKNTCETGFVGD
jgi:hypothetical protein